MKITKNAVVKRINRKLAREEERLVTLRGERGINDLGRHYIIDTHRNTIIAQHVDVLDLARELKVLSEHETIAE